MASGGGSRSTSPKSSNEALDLKCENCMKRGKDREAKTFCQECEEYFCSACTDNHGQFSALRNHKMTSVDKMKKFCGICKAKGKTKVAKSFCKDCDAWICDDCKESHENFRELTKHTIVTSDTVMGSDASAPSDISTRLEQLSTKPLGEPALHPDSETKPQAYAENTNRHLQTKPGEDDASKYPAKAITDSPAEAHGNINVLRYKTIKKIKEIDIKVSGDKSRCDITGCCFMPDGKLVFSDKYNSKLILLDHSLSVVDSLDLPGKPRDVAAVDSNNAIVTMPVEKQLQFIQVLPSLKLGRIIDFDEEYYGVAVAAGKIFLSCYNSGDNVGYIRVHDIDGNDLGKKLGYHPCGSDVFRFPEYVAVSRSGNKIFVSDGYSYRNIVSCLTFDGKIVYQYREDDLNQPQGLLVDDNDNIIVCGCYNSAVVVITSAGRTHKTLLSTEDGISNPQCVSFRPSDGTLVVGGFSDKLLIYKMS